MGSIHPAVSEICVPQSLDPICTEFDKFLGHGQAHLGQMGKWPWRCTTTGLDNSTELRMEKIHQAVTEIWVPQVWQPPARPPTRPPARPPARTVTTIPLQPGGLRGKNVFVKYTKYGGSNTNTNTWFEIWSNTNTNTPYLYLYLYLQIQIRIWPQPCLSALLQLHFHSQLNTWLQYIGQRQLQDETRNIYVWGLGATYIWLTEVPVMVSQ